MKIQKNQRFLVSQRRMPFRKILSLLMIAVLISVSFTIYAPKEAEAAAVNTCALTTTGDFCVEGENIRSEGCQVGHFYLGKRASEVEECKLGTCVPKEGECLSQKSYVECINENQGEWSDQPKQNVPQCTIGCCNVAGSLCSLEEKKYCINDLAGEDSSAFISDITTNEQCNAICNAAVIGCYKQGSICTYGAQEKFMSLPDFSPGNFHANTYCRDVLGCFTEKNSYKACGDGTTNDDNLNVYYYDSNDNREEIVEDCKYPDAFCYDNDGKGGIDAECRSTNCVSGLEEEAEPGNFRTGESLCVNVAPYHYTNEGRSKEIKPYILTCQFGEIKPDDTFKDRNKVCIEETDSEGRLHAKTIDNNWNSCNTCGQGGGILGQVGDVFGFLVPPFSSVFLVLTTKPCKEDGSLTVWNGEKCEDKGKINDIQMCGYGPLTKDDNYDKDLWDPIGSCNPLYPPTDTSSCNLCGGGGDGILNICTVDECNSLGDCQFVRDKDFFNEGTAVAGGMWIGMCTTLAVASQFVAIPGLREGLLASVATACGASAPAVLPSIIMSLYTIGISIGAVSSTQESKLDEAQFDLTENGKVRLSDIIILSKNVGINYEYLGLGGSIGVNVYNLAKILYRTGGKLSQEALEESLKESLKESLEEAAKRAGEKAFDKAVIDNLVEYGVDGVVDTDSKVYQDAYKRTLDKGIDIIPNTVVEIFNVALLLYNVYSLGQSFNPGECVPETAYTNNAKCELCGPGEGQWWCTKERCDVLGQNTGHCRFVFDNDGTPNGKCLPLDVTDANPPIINKINAKISDNNNRIIGSNPYSSSTKTLNIDLLNIANSWRATNITINFETNEDSSCTYTKQSQQIDLIKPDDIRELTKQHELSVDFTDADKTAGNLFIYLRCMDVNQNAIKDDNSFVKITFPPRPDTEPPVIKYIDPNKVMLPASTRNVNLQLVAFDEKGVSECKYSTTKGNHLDMENTFNKNSQNVDCPDLTQGNKKCNLFTTNVDLSTGGTQISYDEIRQQYPDIPEDILTSLENTRTYFYSISCKDTQNNIMGEALNWSLSVVPGFEITVNSPRQGQELYNKILFNITTGGNPTGCNYTIDNTNEYQFGDGLDINHIKLHDDYLTEGSHTVKFECEDWPGNKAEKEATFHVLVHDLAITFSEPDSEIFYENDITLEVKTQGGLYDNGNSTCRYDSSDLAYNRMTNAFEDKFTVLNETTHTKELIDLRDGSYTYYIRCRDDAGKEDNDVIRFRIDTSSTPELRRIYTDGSLLTIEVNQRSECKYSNINFDYNAQDASNFMISSDDGTKHQAVLQEVFYIKCKNLNNNNININPFIIYP